MTTNGTSFLDLQPGDERAYNAMAQAVLEAILKLRARMEAEAGAHPYQEITLEVFQSLIDQADEFVEQCCDKSAKIMCQCAVLSEVRAVPTGVLAREIRAQVFGPFGDYQKSWEGLKQELEPFLAKLSDGSLPYLERLRGSRLWRENSAKLLASMESSLRRFEQIPEQLLDFCCARCSGNQVSLDLQAKAVESVQARVTESIDAMIRVRLADLHAGFTPNELVERSIVYPQLQSPPGPMVRRSFLIWFAVILIALFLAAAVLAYLAGISSESPSPSAAPQ